MSVRYLHLMHRMYLLVFLHVYRICLCEYVCVCRRVNRHLDIVTESESVFVYVQIWTAAASVGLVKEISRHVLRRGRRGFILGEFAARE